MAGGAVSRERIGLDLLLIEGDLRLADAWLAGRIGRGSPLRRFFGASEALRSARLRLLRVQRGLPEKRRKNKGKAGVSYD